MGSISRFGPAVERHITRPAPGSPGVFRRGLALLSLWCLRVAQRRQLAEVSLDPHMLRDLGLTQHDAAREIRKQFWRS
jgi:uncharacterized protein YjiS (DUF1127 family)